MNKFDDRIGLDIFKSTTTYQSDYKRFPIEVRKNLTDQCDRTWVLPKIETIKRERYTDNETFDRWRECAIVPFDTFIQPNEITRSNPHTAFKTPVIPKDSDDKAEAIKTRPRTYMSPAVSLDDVDDPVIRRIVLDHMYTTEFAKATSESAAPMKHKEVPNSTVELGRDPVGFTFDLLPPLPENVRSKGKEWEKAQRRASLNPTEDFWLHKDPPVKCGACVDPLAGLVSPEVSNEIRELILTDCLRRVHDYQIPGYRGFQPRMVYGVGLPKLRLPVQHPLISTYQAIHRRYRDMK